MKFKEAVLHFENMERQNEYSGKKVLNAEQAGIFRSVIDSYVDGGIGVVQGAAGSGKSVLISAIKKYCDANSISCVVTATTGKASSALKGQTIHSYIGLTMQENNNAETVEDAFTLKSNGSDIDLPSILIIDEMSMAGRKILNEILNVGFKYILFVGDATQLPPVKDKKVDWKALATRYYELNKVMRTSNESLLRVFNDFKEQELGLQSGLDIFDYVNNENIFVYDYMETEKLPMGTKSCFVGYRNKLVEKFAKRLQHEDNILFNLNVGVTVTAMVVGEEPVKNSKGYFERKFINRQAYYNGEDVEIKKLTLLTQELVNRGYANYGKWRLSLSKKGILVTDTSAKILSYDNESLADKFWISFPPEEVLEYTTLSVINDDTFALVWDGDESDFKDMEEYYFQQLYPWLKKYQAIRKYYKSGGEGVDISCLDIGVRSKIKSMKQFEFLEWYKEHDDSRMRTKGWSELYSAKSVVSARPSISRTINKAQGISVPCLIMCADSFYGASDKAKYVAVSRSKHGIILIDNVPDDWKES